jgi:MFS family permease
VTSAVMLAGALSTVILVREDRAALRAEWAVSGSGGHLFAPLALVLRSRPARITFGIVLGIGFGVPMVQSTLAPFVATLVAPGQVRTSVALLYSGISVSGAVAAIIAGRGLRRVGAPPILIISSLAAGVMLLPQGATHALWQLAPLVVAMAFFQGAIQTSTAGLIASIVSHSAVSAGFGLYQSVQAASAQVAPALGGALASSFGFRAVFPAAGSVLLAASIVAARYLPKAAATALQKDDPAAPTVAAASSD